LGACCFLTPDLAVVSIYQILASVFAIHFDQLLPNKHGQFTDTGQKGF
jgi:hypothetical protein